MVGGEGGRRRGRKGVGRQQRKSREEEHEREGKKVKTEKVS